MKKVDLPVSKEKTSESRKSLSKETLVNSVKTTMAEPAKPAAKEKSAEPPKVTPSESSKSKKKKRVIAESDDDEDTASAGKSVVELSSSMVRAEDKAAMEAMMDMDVDEAEEQEPSASGSTSVSVEKPKAKSKKERMTTVKQERVGSEGLPEVKKETGRKRRQVMRSETVQNEKGYMGMPLMIRQVAIDD